MYKYEMHCHATTGSKCSRITPSTLVDLYLENGYSGIFLTDHFLNGNCLPEIKDPNKSYEERIRLYCNSYRALQEAAKDKIDVFFGFEYSYYGTDILVYGLDEDFLLSHPEMQTMSPKEFIRFANENGALTVQAHPFREDPWIDHIRLFPDTTGVEVFNACQKDSVNAMADYYAIKRNLIPSAGSDLHSASQSIITGLQFEEKIASVSDFIEKFKKGEGQIFKQINCFHP